MIDTREVRIGSVRIGGSNRVAVQTMYDIPLSRLEQGFEGRMRNLMAMGCDIMRFSYPDISEHDGLKRVVDLCPMPVVADIHFDWRLAMDAMDCGVAKVRINPGNIGARWKTEEVVRKALDTGTAIRIGLNSGSLPHGVEGKDVPHLMSDTAMEYISCFEALGFRDTVVSLKASDPDTTFEACRLFSSMSDCPQHLGVTEAGGTVSSCVRTTWTLGRLLTAGIGDTIRYSITGSIEDEVQAANELLRTLGMRKGGVRIVSCPMCGRRTFDSQAFLSKVQDRLLACGKDICIAIMGCQVNGPGEAKGADIAVSGIGNKVCLFKKGVLAAEIDASEAEKALFDAIGEIE